MATCAAFLKITALLLVVAMVYKILIFFFKWNYLLFCFSSFYNIYWLGMVYIKMN